MRPGSLAPGMPRPPDPGLAAFVRIGLAENAMTFVEAALALLASCEDERDLPEPVRARAQEFRRIVSAGGW